MNLVEVDGVDPQPLARLAGRRQQRGAHVHLPRARHELGRDDHPVAHAGVGGEQAADDALALAASVDLGGVEEDDARGNARLPRLADARLRQGLVVAAHAPGALVAPGPRAHAQGRDGDIGAGELDAIAGLRRRGVAHCATGDVAAQARCASTAARHSGACVSCGEWYAPGMTVSRPFRHLGGQLRRLVDQRVVVLAHNDRRRAGDGGEPGPQGGVVVRGITHQRLAQCLHGVRVHADEDGVLLLAPLGRRVRLDQRVLGATHAERRGHAPCRVERVDEAVDEGADLLVGRQEGPRAGVHEDQRMHEVRTGQ